MSTTTIDVSAQFGGRDAAEAVLPHFRALKGALKGKVLDGFPFRQLAFILRVDGEVNTYGDSGPGNVQFDKNGRYVSVDICITRADLVGRDAAEVSAFVVGAIISSISLLKGLGDPRLRAVEWEALEIALKAFCAAYRSQLGQGDAEKNR